MDEIGESKTTKRIALIPAYCPGQFLLGVVEDMSHSGFDCIVVNDGSGEKYDEVFTAVSKRATLLSHDVNKGKGRAIKTGLEYVIERYPDEEVYIVTIDADGQHKVSDALKLMDALSAHPEALILGVRAFDKMPFKSRIGNETARIVYNMSTGHDITDTQTGLRAFSSRYAPLMAEIPGERYEYEINVLLECPRNGIDIDEVTIETIYIDNNSGSHYKPVRDSLRIFKEILKFSASSFASFLVDYGFFSLFAFLFAKTALTESVALITANVLARVISATFNYILNRKFVFKDKSGIAKSALGYFLLCVTIIILNSAVLTLLTETLKINQYLAKPITEGCIFILNWAVQHFVIFRKKGDK